MVPARLQVTYSGGAQSGGGLFTRHQQQRLTLDVAGGEFITWAEMAHEEDGSELITFLRLVTTRGRELLCGRVLTDTAGRVVRDDGSGPQPMLGTQVKAMPPECPEPGACELVAVRGVATTHVHAVRQPFGSAAAQACVQPVPFAVAAA